MQKINSSLSMAEIIGEWEPTSFESGLIKRCRDAWSKPLSELTNQELATFLRQDIGVDCIIPIARERIEYSYCDDTEIDDDELESALNKAIKKQRA